MLQSISAAPYLGKRVRFSAALRTEAVGDAAGLYFGVYGPLGVMATDNMTDRPVRGSVDWAKFSLVLEVPSNAICVSFGAWLSGPGMILVDDAALATVSTDVPLTDMMPGGGGLHTTEDLEVVAGPVNLGFEE